MYAMEELRDHPLVEKIDSTEMKGASVKFVRFNKPVEGPAKESFVNAVHQEQMSVIEQGKMYAILDDDGDLKSYVGTVSVPDAFHVNAPNMDVARNMIHDKVREELGIEVEVDWVQEE